MGIFRQEEGEQGTCDTVSHGRQCPRVKDEEGPGFDSNSTETLMKLLNRGET